MTRSRYCKKKFLRLSDIETAISFRFSVFTTSGIRSKIKLIETETSSSGAQSEFQVSMPPMFHFLVAHRILRIKWYMGSSRVESERSLADSSLLASDRPQFETAADKPDRIAVTSTSSRAKSSPRKITLNLQLTGPRVPRCRAFRSCNRERQLSFPTTRQRNRQSGDESLGDSMKHLWSSARGTAHRWEKHGHKRVHTRTTVVISICMITRNGVHDDDRRCNALCGFAFP